MQLKCIELWLLAFNLILARSFQILLVAKDFEILDQETINITKLLNDKSNSINFDNHFKKRMDSSAGSEKEFNIKINNTRNEKEKFLLKKRSTT